MSLKAWMRALTPPLLWRVAKAVFGRPVRRPDWEYVPEGWRVRDPRIKGWGVASVVETEKARWHEFVRAVKGTGPLGVAHEATSISNQDPCAHNLFMTYGYVLATAARKKSSVSILDWGCGLGHHYVISKALFPEVALDYHGRDLPLMCQAAREIQPDATFHDDEGSCFQRRYDLVMANVSLHYSEDWKEVVLKLALACEEYLFISRLPVVCTVPSFVVVQRPYTYGYDTEYLGWYLNRDEFLDHLRDLGMELVREFLNLDRVIVRGAPEQGKYRSFLFRAKTDSQAVFGEVGAT